MPPAHSHAAPAVVYPSGVGRWLIEDLGDVLILQSESALQPFPSNWKQRLLGALETISRAGAIGAKRVDPEGKIVSMGEFIIHPKSFHLLGLGLEKTAYRFPEEVDAILGGVVAIRKSTWRKIYGEETLTRPLGMLDLCLALRATGERCLVTPDVSIIDTYNPLFDERINDEQRKAFVERWGFDWRGADLEAVKIRHAGSGLIWNHRFFGQSMPFEKYDCRPDMHWKSYDEMEAYRQRADHLAELVRQVAATTSGVAHILDLGCGDGLFVHLFAQAGARVTGLDPEDSAITQATRQITARAALNAYSGPVPTLITGHGEALPLENGSVNVVALLDVIEHLPNPVAVLREVDRVLAPGGALVISTPGWQFGGSSDAIYHVCEYTPSELAEQINAATNLHVSQTGRIGGMYRDIIVVANKS